MPFPTVTTGSVFKQNESIRATNDAKAQGNKGAVVFAPSKEDDKAGGKRYVYTHKFSGANWSASKTGGGKTRKATNISLQNFSEMMDRSGQTATIKPFITENFSGGVHERLPEVLPETSAQAQRSSQERLPAYQPQGNPEAGTDYTNW